MNFLEKLDALKKETGDNNASLARRSGIAYTTIDGLYKKGYANMKLSTLQALSDYFQVSIDYLAKDDEGVSGEEENPVLKNENEVDHDRISFLFLSLTEENQRKLLDYAQLLLGSQQADRGSRE